MRLVLPVCGLLLFMMLCATTRSAAQISPGPLSQAHHALDGATGCTDCHKLSTGEPTFNCLECHTEIASRVAGHRGLHASYDLQIGSSQPCARCHSEHNGEDFKLVKFDPKTFDHKQTGYPLEGKHAGPGCKQCHAPQHIAESERATIKVKDLTRTYLGLSTACSTCHQDPHMTRLGQDCLQCHNFSGWKAIRVGKFDHSKTRYPLTGLHVEVGCQECHKPGPDRKPRYTGIAFGGCSSCHSDPHRGGFEQSCESCHSTAGWKKISGILDETFDHSKTKYPLLGKHAAVDCVACHSGGDFKKPVAFKKCTDCHQPDPHGGQFVRRLGGSECESCHTVNGFKPSTFGRKQHAATKYPLEGKHAELACAKCHLPTANIRDLIFKLKFDACTDCHADQHAGQFSGAPYANACEKCHSLQRFMPSTFGLARHKETRFQLTGSHVAVACNDCHKPSAGFKPKPTAVYHWQALSCTACHADPHQNQFVQLMSRPAAEGKSSACESCHSTVSWTDLARFDHSRTSFALMGAHLTASCGACHVPAKPGVKVAQVNFKLAPTQCEQCHVEAHGRQFAQNGVTACKSCHNEIRWKPSLFDHDQRTNFPLQGAHQHVACAGCHKLTRSFEGKSVLFYKPTPSECSDCHRSGAPQKKEGMN